MWWIKKISKGEKSSYINEKNSNRGIFLAELDLPSFQGTYKLSTFSSNPVKCEKQSMTTEGKGFGGDLSQG